MTRARGRMTLGDAAILSLLASGGTVASGLVQSKVAAVLLGPTGVGEIAEVRQAALTALVPASVFVGPAIVSAVAEAHGAGDLAGVRLRYGVAATAYLAASIACGALAVAGGALLRPSTWGAHPVWAITLATAGYVFASWASLPAQLFVAVGQLRLSTAVTIGIALLTTIGICAGTYTFGVLGQLGGIALGGFLAWPLMVGALAKRAGGIDLVPHFAWDVGALRALVRVGGAALVAAFAGQIALSVIRWVLARNGGAALNGQFQAAFMIGGNYLAVILASLGNFVFPRYAASPDTASLQAEIEEAGRFVCRVAPPIVLLGLALRALMVRVLYTSQFEVAVDILGLQMSSDVAKTISFVQAGPLLYRGKVRAFMLTEIVGTSALAVSSAVLVPRLGAIGVGYAYIVCHTTYALVTWATVRRVHNVRVRFDRVLLGILFAAAGPVVIHSALPPLLLQAALVATALVWTVRAGLVHDAYVRARALVTSSRSE